MQAHFGVRIAEDPGDPGISAFDLDAELLADLAPERLRDRFAGSILPPGNSQ